MEIKEIPHKIRQDGNENLRVLVFLRIWKILVVPRSIMKMFIVMFFVLFYSELGSISSGNICEVDSLYIVRDFIFAIHLKIAEEILREIIKLLV